MENFFLGHNEINDLLFKNMLMAVCSIIAGVLRPLYCPSEYGYYYYYFYPKDVDGTVFNVYIMCYLSTMEPPLYYIRVTLLSGLSSYVAL